MIKEIIDRLQKEQSGEGNKQAPENELVESKTNPQDADRLAYVESQMNKVFEESGALNYFLEILKEILEKDEMLKKFGWIKPILKRNNKVGFFALTWGLLEYYSVIKIMVDADTESLTVSGNEDIIFDKNEWLYKEKVALAIANAYLHPRKGEIERKSREGMSPPSTGGIY
jgi:hypothetical protein